MTLLTGFICASVARADDNESVIHNIHRDGEPHRAIFEYDVREELREARGLWPALTVSRTADRRPATGECSDGGFEEWAEREFGDIRGERGSRYTAWVPREDAVNEPVEIEWADHIVVEPPAGRPAVVRCGTPRAEVMGGER